MLDQLQRLQLLEHQSRAFLEGDVENINEQWVFFDSETEEATMLEHYLNQEIEIYLHHKWIKGTLDTDGQIVHHNNKTIFLYNKMKLRIRKQIVFSFDMLLDELKDDIFIQFINTLNSLEFSIYDCIFSHNHLSFLDTAETKKGVNILIFDNGESVLAVHHHFIREEEQNHFSSKNELNHFSSKNELDHFDRFEFTLSTGKRLIIDKMQK